jgi:16S rRNA (adenine1518-N6/adenine1519-N6)-dimethyltransferase
LEVGPGLGALTVPMVGAVKRLVAVEKDRNLIEPLKTACAEALAVKSKVLEDSFEILEKDILKMTAEDLRALFAGEKYKVVANLPYNITSHFLKNFLETDYAPTEMLLMVQKEVGERITAKAGQMSILAVSVQFFSEPEIVFQVGRRNFAPAPKVDSVIIRLKNIHNKRFDIAPEKLFAVVKAGFSAKRKKLKSNLVKFGAEKVAEAFNVLGLKEMVRAQELSVEEWVKIALSV